MAEHIKSLFDASKFAWMVGAGLTALTVYVVTIRVELNTVMADGTNTQQELRLKNLEDENHKKDLRLQSIESQLRTNTTAITGNTKAISDLEKAVESNTSVTKTGVRESQETQRMIIELKSIIQKGS